MVENKNCLFCGTTLSGRSDKKYCDDNCRNNYHYRLKKDSNIIIKSINASLIKNREILKSFITGMKTVVLKEKFVELNFDFDERRNTPEMISQIGQKESKDELIFSNDSIVDIKMLTYEGDYRYAKNEKSEITFGDATSDNNKLGVLKNNKIYSEQNTVIGKMRIFYKI